MKQQFAHSFRPRADGKKKQQNEDTTGKRPCYYHLWRNPQTGLSFHFHHLVRLVPCSSFITCTMQEVMNNVTVLFSVNIYFIRIYFIFELAMQASCPGAPNLISDHFCHSGTLCATSDHFLNLHFGVRNNAQTGPPQGNGYLRTCSPFSEVHKFEEANNTLWSVRRLQLFWCPSSISLVPLIVDQGASIQYRYSHYVNLYTSQGEYGGYSVLTYSMYK